MKKAAIMDMLRSVLVYNQEKRLTAHDIHEELRLRRIAKRPFISPKVY
jgi:hypothetical protein